MSGSAWSNQIVSAVIVAGPNGRVLVYDAAPPSAGHLIGSMAGQQFNDVPGNLVLAGVTQYVHRVAAPAQFLAGNLGGTSVAFYTATTEAGPWTLLGVTGYAPNSTLAPPTGMVLSNATSGALIDITDAVTFGTGTQAAAEFLGCFAAAANPADNTVEVWHDLGTLAGYTVNRAQYKLGVENQTWLYINVTSGGANAASVNFSNTLPVAYRPTQVVFQPLTSSGASTAPVRVSLSAAGGVQITQQANNTIQILGVVPIPLD